MGQPTPYNRQYDLTDYQTDHPSAPYSGSQVDAEFDAIETTLDEVLANLALIQRDDGELANQSVAVDQLASDVRALLAINEDVSIGNWVTATAYTVGDVVAESAKSYLCVTDHTSGTFATDLAASKWVIIGTASVAASGITFTPTGTIAATDVQAAIAEVASESLKVASNLSDVGSVATARSNLSVPSKAELQNASFISSDAGGTADAITASYTPAITALTDKMILQVVAAVANATTTPTFTPNSGTITVRTIVKGSNEALLAGDIPGDDAGIFLQYNEGLDKWVLLNPAVSAGALPKAGGTMTGNLVMSGATINDAKGADVASAATINLDTTTGNVVDVTGTTTITAITLSEGRERVVRFTGILTLTHNANIICPGAASITTAAGDYAVFRGYSGGVVRVTAYMIAALAPFDRRAPGAIGGTTPGAGTFTDLTAGGSVVLGDGAGDTLTVNAETISQPNVPCFFARNNASDANQTGNGATVTVEFDSETFDQSSDFDTTTDTFTAVATGKYELHTQVRVAAVPAGATTFVCNIVTSNRTYVQTFVTVAGTFTTFVWSFSVLADMDAADTALVQIQISGGAGDTASIVGAVTPTTFFSGRRAA